MSLLSRLDLLRLVRDIDAGYDVEFKWKEKEEDEGRVVARAHKIILASLSATFKTMFFGDQSHNFRMDSVVYGTDFSPEAYSIFVKVSYGLAEVIDESHDLNLVLQVYGLTLKYLMIPEVVETVVKRIYEIEVTIDNVFYVLETVAKFQDLLGFEEISKQLSIKVVIKVKSAHKTVEDLSYFVSQHILDRPSLLKVLMELIYTTDIEKCTNCLLPLDECKDGQPISSVPHLGLRFTQDTDENLEATDDYNIVLEVHSTKDRHNSGILIQQVDFKNSGGNMAMDCLYYPEQFRSYDCRYKCKYTPALQEMQQREQKDRERMLAILDIEGLPVTP